MQLACPDCGAPVEVTSSFANCLACGADVASHYTPADMIRTVYHRALELYSMGNEVAALEGIRQGIDVLDAPELHLLAALIYRKQGEYKEMREHVAAIPADDILRGEGEWLLRSHQEQLQQGRREVARKRGQTTAKGKQLAEGKANRQFSTEYYPAPLEKKQAAPDSGAPDQPAKPRRNRLPWAIPIAAVLLGAIFLLQGTADSLLTALRQLRTVPEGLTSVYSSFTEDEPEVETGAAASIAAIEETATPTPPPEEPAATASPTPEPPLPTPTASEMDSASVAATIVAAREQTFDLAAYLTGLDRPDLAALPLQATWDQGTAHGELTLQGIVPLMSDRIELLALAEGIDGVAVINDVDLVVQLPETYTVRVGENLRHIAYRLWGDSALWEGLYSANQALIGEDPNNLWVGLALTVPQEQSPEVAPP